MKFLQKMISLLLAVLLMMSLAVTAMAEDQLDGSTDTTTDLTIAGGEGRTFNVYKILNASISGSNYDYTVNSKYLDVLKAASGKTTEAEILKYINDMPDNKSEIRAFADDLYREILADSRITADYPAVGNNVELDQGYYLVADVTTSLGSAAYSLVMLGTMGESDLTINLKAEAPTLVKKVDDENDSIMGNAYAGNEDTESWNDTADYDIGDSIPYRIAMEMPNDLENYTYYAMVMTDELSAGLEFTTIRNNEKFLIFVNGEERTIAEAGSAATGVDFLYHIETVGGVQKLYVYPNAGYTTNGDEAKVPSYENGGDAKKVGIKNNDTIVLRYRCRLTEKAVIGNPGNPNHAWLKYSNNPYGDTFGETVKDYCIVFTYQVLINKVDGERKPLKGAKFRLDKFVAAETGMGSETVHGVEGNWVEGEVTEGTGDNENIFTFTGLDDGYYRLVETDKPDGFTQLDPICFHLAAGHKLLVEGEDKSALIELTYTTDVAGSINFTVDKEAGSYAADVVNKSGTILPSTGGMGTTLFYIAGGIMAVAAVVLLVTKKRMSNEV